MDITHIDQCEQCGANGADIPTGADDGGDGTIHQLYICANCARESEFDMEAQINAEKSAEKLYDQEMRNLGWVPWAEVRDGCWYWWWNEDPDGCPIPVSVLYSPTTDNYFATQGQLGWTRPQDLSEMRGWWMKLVEPGTVRHPNW